MSTQRQKKPREKLRVSEELSLKSTVDLGELLTKLKAEVEKGGVKYYTPYTLASAYGIKISDAKKVLNEAVKQGFMKIYSGGRRVKIYVPV
ncbi:MAG: 30S ribosomal protein S25e [Thermosphaera sp.]|jgi:ribosomal protein S25|nr:30S ribosomal protein S25e [Thermosphaera sp.]